MFFFFSLSTIRKFAMSLYSTITLSNYWKKQQIFGDKQLLKGYRHPVFLRFQANNFFIHTFFNRFTHQHGYKMSAGLLEDYRKKKKKKKSYMLGLDLGMLFTEILVANSVSDLSLFMKGNGAQKKGLYQAFNRNALTISSLIDKTPIVHNGTRSYKRRRL